MKPTLFVIVAIIMSTISGAEAQDKQDRLINTASLLSGAFMRESPASYTPTNLMLGDIQNYAPEALFDQSPKLWCSQEGARFPFVFQIELTETFDIQKLEFDNRCEDYPGIAAKDLSIQFATTVRNPRFEPIGDFTLRENDLNSFDIEAREARIIRIEIRSNHGNSQYTELAEFKALGIPKLPDIRTIAIDGRWRSNWGDVFFQQNNTLFNGHYVYNEGKIRFGGIERNRLSYRWVEKKIQREGQTLMFLNQEGTRLTGVWCYDDNWKEFGFWILERDSGVPFAPASATDPAPQAEVVEAVVDEMRKELTSNRKLILYGINFRKNSSEILPASISVLRQLAELLSATPDLKIRIEGHTDSDGGLAYNDRLSNERAAAVQTYLTSEHGIAIERIDIEGKGERFPVSSNETEFGKAANRRVEIHQSFK